jgi:hypothetical protein
VLDEDQLTPYGSFIIATWPGTTRPNATSAKALALEAKTALAAQSNKRGETIVSMTDYAPRARAGVKAVGWWRTVKVVSPWSHEVFDIRNDLLLVMWRRERIAIYASDGELRRTLLQHVGNAASAPSYRKLSDLSRVRGGQLIKAFVDSSKLRSLWLSGAHKSVSVKPDSKIISGKDLASALDPLADSTYLASAARGEQAGVSVRASSIWTKQHESLSELQADVALRFDALDAAAGAVAEIPVISSEAPDLTGVEGAFDFEIADPDTLTSERLRNTAAALAGDIRYAVVPPAASAAASDFKLNVEAIDANGAVLETRSLEVSPAIRVAGESRIAFGLTWSSAPTNEALIKLGKAFKESPRLFRVFYDSAHTITDGSISKSTPRDMQFDKWEWALLSAPIVAGSTAASYRADWEKPRGNVLHTIWSTTNENSLFSWCVHAVSSPVHCKKLHVEPLNTVTRDVWLYCDDDAGEAADFLHLHAPAAAPSTVTFVHIKGARNDGDAREMVAGPYEVVCSQAVKNLRHLFADRFLDDIAQRINDVKRPLWNEPFTFAAPTGNKATFSTKLRQAMLAGDTRIQVVVFQPHVTKRAHALTANKALSTTASHGSVQLRALLNGTRLAAATIGAEFWVVGEETPVP